MRARRRAGRAATSVALLAALAAGLLTPAAAQTARSCDGVDVAGAWATIETPAVVTAFALGPAGILVTDGQSVYRSDDGGCSWRGLLTLPGTPSARFPFVTERITAIAAPTERDVYLALTGPHVVVSRDAGRTWATADSGLAGRADRSELTVAPSDSDVLYLVTRTTASDEPLNGPVSTSSGTTATISTLYVSRDGARTWSVAGGVPPPASVKGPRGQGISQGAGPGSIWELAVEPDDPQRLWAVGTEGVFTSADGGATWTGEVMKSDVVKGLDVRAIDVPGTGATPSVVAVDPASGAVYTTAASGGASSWARRAFPGFQTIASIYPMAEPVSLAHSEDGTLVGASPKGAFRLDPDGWSDISPVGLGSGANALADLTAAPGEASTFYARPTAVGTSLYRYVAGEPDDSGSPRKRNSSGSESPLEQLSHGIGALAPPRPARLTPRAVTVRLAPGESATRTFELVLPPHPTPVDLFFLLDTTSSMNGVVRSLARSVASIVAELRADGIDVWPGLGQFRTYPYPGEEDVNFPYRRNVPVSPPGRKLARALLAIEGDGQSGANLTALLQSVSPAPLDLLPPGPSRGDVPEDSDAGFRSDSLRVIVHAADSPFGTTERGDPDGNKYPPGTWPGARLRRGYRGIERRAGPAGRRSHWLRARFPPRAHAERARGPRAGGARDGRACRRRGRRLRWRRTRRHRGR
jgi:hypothetical protein